MLHKKLTGVYRAGGAGRAERGKAFCAGRGINARCYACDIGVKDEVDRLFDGVKADLGVPVLVVYNPSRRVRAPFVGLDPDEREKALCRYNYGGFLAG